MWPDGVEDFAEEGREQVNLMIGLGKLSFEPYDEAFRYSAPYPRAGFVAPRGQSCHLKPQLHEWPHRRIENQRHQPGLQLGGGFVGHEEPAQDLEIPAHRQVRAGLASETKRLLEPSKAHSSRWALVDFIEQFSQIEKT